MDEAQMEFMTSDNGVIFVRLSHIIDWLVSSSDLGATEKDGGESHKKHLMAIADALTEFGHHCEEHDQKS